MKGLQERKYVGDGVVLRRDANYGSFELTQLQAAWSCSLNPLPPSALAKLQGSSLKAPHQHALKSVVAGKSYGLATTAATTTCNSSLVGDFRSCRATVLHPSQHHLL